MISKKIHFPDNLLDDEQSDMDLMEKIKILSEEMRAKTEKITELEIEMDLQHDFVKRVDKEKKITEHENQQYELKLESMKGERQKIQEKMNKYKDKLRKYLKRKKNESENFPS